MISKNILWIEVFLAITICGASTLCLNQQALAKKHADSSAKSAAEYLKTGIESYKKRDFDSAIDSLKQAIYFARNGYNPDAFHYLALSHMAKNEDEEAIAAFTKEIEQAEVKTPETYVLMGRVLYRDNRLKEAEKIVNEALRQSSMRLPEAHQLQGHIYEKEGNWRNAHWQFSQAMGRRPWTNGEIWLDLAECDMRMKDWLSALKELDMMEKEQSRLEKLDLVRMHYLHGACSLNRGDHQGAIEHFHSALQYNPDYANAHLQLGIIFELENHISSAIKEYEQYVRLGDDQTKVTKANERIAFLEHKLSQPTEVKMPVPRPHMEVGPMEAPQTPTEASDPTPVPLEPGF